MTIQEMMTKENCDEDTLHDLLADKMIARLKERTQKKSIKLILHKGETDVLESKLGGVPYLPKNGEYPVDSFTGNKLFFLIQLNFAEIPHLESYPTSGILQIFIGDDDIYGENYQDCQCQDSWRIIYHENIEDPMLKEEVKKLLYLSRKFEKMRLFQGNLQLGLWLMLQSLHFHML